MPIIKSAKKKLRKDVKRTAHNAGLKLALKNLIRQVRRENSADKLQQVSSALDKAVKSKLIHANKAARLKSRLAKATPSSASPKPASKSRTSKAKPKKTTSSRKR